VAAPRDATDGTWLTSVRVLITGATGFLGYHLCARLVSLGHQVTAFHRAQSRTERIAALGVGLIQGELGDLDGLRRAVGGHQAAIHAAGQYRFWSADADVQDQVNVQGTSSVAQACRLEGARMLHVSSMAAIGIPEDPAHPADETFAFNLEGTRLHYHLTKKRGEAQVLEEVAKGLDAVIVNPGSIFGPHGSTYRGGEMIRKVAGQRIVPYFTGGICTVHVADVVSGALEALHRGVRGNRYILGGENLTYREIARRSLDALGLHRPLVQVPPLLTAILGAAMVPVGRLQGRMPRFTPQIHYCSRRYQFYSSDKARAELGFAPRNFDAIIRECLGVQSPPGGTSDEPRK
jgi:dihydroflavonol-4-reductase